MNDRTAEKRTEIQKEQKPSFHHLLRLFLYVFRATKGSAASIWDFFCSAFFLKTLLRKSGDGIFPWWKMPGNV